MLARIWETHKGFIIGIVVALLFLVVAYQVAVSPMIKQANKDMEEAEDTRRNLQALYTLDAEEPPTESTAKKYREASSRLMTQLDSLKKAAGFPIQSPFILPAGKALPEEAYYEVVFSKTKREIETAAKSRAIIFPDTALVGSRVEREKVPEALVALAVVRRALLTAVASGVTSIEKVNLELEERSAPVESYRLCEKLVTVTVQGTPQAVQKWLASLGRRNAFLMVAVAEISAPSDPEADHSLVTAKVRLGPLTIEEQEMEELGEEEYE